MKSFFSELLKWFLIINTGIMAVAWLNIFSYDSILTSIIPQIFCASFMTSIVTTAIFSYNPKKPMNVPMRIFLYCGHYLVLCVIIMSLGSLFDWFEFSPTGCLAVALSVAGVYFIAVVISYILSKSEAIQMTNALKNFNEE